MDGEKQEKLEFQYIMNYKAYRRKMIATRVTISLVAFGGAMGLCALSVTLALIIGGMLLFAGAISVIVSLHNERTYMIFNTRFVIKNRDKRVSVPLESITKVERVRGFYEKDLATSTIVITAKSPETGKSKKYKMKHVFDAAAGAEYLQNSIGSEKNDG